MMPTLNTLVDANELRARLADPHRPRLLDCGFDLSDLPAGERAWAAGHLPGALYAHLERDLSGPTRDAAGRFHGRHPLPAREVFAATLGRWGIGPATPVVAYDAQGGPYAARAWWLLRWMGHADVAVLDGGRAAWQAAGGELETDAAPVPALPPYPLHAAQPALYDAAALLAHLGRVRLVDARAGERFRGEVEPLDRAAGHIPGARNRFFKDNLDADGRFKAPVRLRAEWSALLAGESPVVHYCGSGVTACHNLLAVAHAGLGEGLLYPGSWSEWSDDPARPQAQGE
jgi:thiosulfate/3-mercaptopyruvate sulfurtransferase